jgi:hypothetical protein
MLLLVTDCGFQGRVVRLIVMMKEPVVIAPKFRSFSSHIFSQASQNVTIKVSVDCSVRWDKFMVNNLLHAEKNSGPAMPLLLFVIMGSSTATVVALFLDHNHKSYFHHPL